MTFTEANTVEQMILDCMPGNAAASRSKAPGHPWLGRFAWRGVYANPLGLPARRTAPARVPPDRAWSYQAVYECDML